MLRPRNLLRAFYTSKDNLVYRHHGVNLEVGSLGYFSQTLLDEDLVMSFFCNPLDIGRRKRYLQFLHEGKVGILIHREESWASVGWLSTPTSSPPPHVPSSLAGGFYWLHHQHTAEPFRGRGLHKASILACLNFAFTKGPPGALVLTDVAEHNYISRRSQSSVGFSPAGRLTLRRIAIPRLCYRTWGTWDRTAPHPPIPRSA